MSAIAPIAPRTLLEGENVLGLGHDQGHAPRVLQVGVGEMFVIQIMIQGSLRRLLRCRRDNKLIEISLIKNVKHVWRDCVKKWLKKIKSWQP